MTVFQLILLGGSAYFAFKIYQHVQTLQDTQENEPQSENTSIRTAESFSTFSSETLIENADKERENNNLDKALSIYREANIKDPDNAEVLFKMGYTLSLLGRDLEALEDLLESISKDDSNPFAYEEVSKLYRKLGDEVKADQYHASAVKIDENI